ncbi:MAG TPA: hypothetical protein VNN22_06450 [Verrucomicrobiae bacterium]|nr:hypothetical protein [Verrucomicrobiae bacterium]
MKLNAHIQISVVAALCVLSLSPATVFAGGLGGLGGDLAPIHDYDFGDPGLDPTPETMRPSEERGVIKSVDLNAHTLVVTGHKKNTDQKFQWTDQTKFIEHDKSVTTSDLKEGERVHLIYMAGSTTPTLKSVHINSAKTNAPSVQNNSSARSSAD